MTASRLPAAALAALLALAFLFWALDATALWSGLVGGMLALQRELHAGLATAIRAVGESGPMAGFGLVAIAFLYGVFHAAGPGHGKVVITTYLASQKETLARGIALAVAAALLQGLTAIAAVAGSVVLLERTMRDAQAFAGRLDLVSFGLVTLLGGFLVWRGGRSLQRRRQAAAADCCGHHHALPPRTAFLAGVLAIGLRPCTGAILVLALAFAFQLRLAGIAAVMAMSLGTAFATSALAALAVYARSRAATLAARMGDDPSRLGALGDVAAVAGGIVIAAFGLSLLQAGLATPAHPLF